jgi:conjugal transfer pilus assembly protein TraW
VNCKLVIPFLIPLVLATGSAQATSTKTKDLGTVGETFPVLESDVVAELKQEAIKRDKAIDNNLFLEQMKKYQPVNLHTLPHATANKTFLIDITYTLDHDLVDGDGNILYPSGYTWNPMDYVSFPGGLVVIDGDDPLQVDWFKTSPYFEKYRTKLLLTDGYASLLVEKLKRPVFYLTDDISKRLQIAAVPSVVIQKGNKMLVSEVLVVPTMQENIDEDQ